MRNAFTSLVFTSLAGVLQVAPVMAHETAPAMPAPVAYAVVAHIAGADGGWDYASVDAVRGRLYVARSNAIMMADLATGKVTDVLAPAQRSHAIVPLDQGQTLAETDGTSGMTRFINADTGAVIAEVATGKKPDFAFVESATGLLVVLNPGSNAVVLIDPKTHAIVRTITVPGGLEAGGDNGHGIAYANLEDANALAFIDLNAGKLIKTVPLTGCDGPTGLAVVAGGTRVLSACSNGVTTVVDTATGAVVQTIPVGKGPDAIIVDTARKLAFVPSGRDGNLTAIRLDNPAQFTVAATIPTQIGARTGAIDPRDGKIYLPTATMMPAGEGQRPTARPGSFVVVVVAPKA